MQHKETGKQYNWHSCFLKGVLEATSGGRTRFAWKFVSKSLEWNKENPTNDLVGLLRGAVVSEQRRLTKRPLIKDLNSERNRGCDGTALSSPTKQRRTSEASQSVLSPSRTVLSSPPSLPRPGHPLSDLRAMNSPALDPEKASPVKLWDENDNHELEEWIQILGPENNK